jgi:hypothetical protein
MAANKFVLRGSGAEVDYTIGATSSLPALVYKAGAFHKSFKPAEIVSEDTGLGRMVSVSLIRSVDTGGERFGFFLPFIDVDRGQTATSTQSAFMKRLADRMAFDMALHRNEGDGQERDRALMKTLSRLDCMPHRPL